MTDTEIIKALEEELKTALTINHRFEESNDTENPDDHRFIALLSRTIKLINRQKAEIERLKESNEKQRLIIESIDDNMFPLPFETDYDKAIKTAKNEAIKEFAGMLKSKAKTGKGYLGNVYHSVSVNDIDETYREMVGDNNAE